MVYRNKKTANNKILLSTAQMFFSCHLTDPTTSTPKILCCSYGKKSVNLGIGFSLVGDDAVDNRTSDFIILHYASVALAITIDILQHKQLRTNLVHHSPYGRFS